ncbi:MAG: hypothetical protein UY48_C0002G0053 [Candidatus Gottesmanbacteria bacterium GW2011_GWB1_49_7]|uniref:Uncharacterized protein n=1 Tax=Candidatus Gottesmanbacteria bacterium GW2011_GWB1_49_7 TaxID=1618448 RepID=A0A0G1YEG1_9BACT|nr:MAG: hypothetical protein UY48_C0002G0053 [Candidatus Gottesmanbacteria bacterium GW2011_GWB1_49_7]
MEEQQLAAELGFADVAALATATTDFCHGDYTWAVTPLPDGRYAAWDSGGYDPRIYATWNEAVDDQIAGSLTGYEFSDSVFAYLEEHPNHHAEARRWEDEAGRITGWIIEICDESGRDVGAGLDECWGS